MGPTAPSGRLAAAVILAVAGAAGLWADASAYGARAALGQTGLSLEQMLVYAIQDEYLARAEYELIMSEHGRVRPFSNIAQAEERHIEMYTAFLAEDLPAEVRDLFQRLKAASENHLQAFRQQRSRYN